MVTSHWLYQYSLRVDIEMYSPPVLGKEEIMKSFSIFSLLFLFLLTSPLTAMGVPDGENLRIKLTTTTSTDNSGLLEYLLPYFKEKTGYSVDVIAVGTGAAIELGKKGDVDVVLVHAREQEDAFIEAGYGIKRRDVMYNDFVIIGPVSDSAGIGDAKTVEEAFSLIAKAEAHFISRGDNSGTHIREKYLWRKANINPEGKWYKEAGQGMGAVITITDDLQGYTLSDRGTYNAMRSNINLVVLFEGGEELFNPYGIIAVNPERHPHVNFKGATALIEWITGEEAQLLIKQYRIDGHPLFYPMAR